MGKKVLDVIKELQVEFKRQDEMLASLNNLVHLARKAKLDELARAALKLIETELQYASQKTKFFADMKRAVRFKVGIVTDEIIEVSAYLEIGETLYGFDDFMSYHYKRYSPRDLTAEEARLIGDIMLRYSGYITIECAEKLKHIFQTKNIEPCLNGNFYIKIMSSVSTPELNAIHNALKDEIQEYCEGQLDRLLALLTVLLYNEDYRVLALRL